MEEWLSYNEKESIKWAYDNLSSDEFNERIIDFINTHLDIQRRIIDANYARNRNQSNLIKEPKVRV